MTELPACPYCSKSDAREAAESASMFVTAIESMASGDVDLFAATCGATTDYDYHIAVSLVSYLLEDLHRLGKLNGPRLLRSMREQYIHAMLNSEPA